MSQPQLSHNSFDCVVVGGNVSGAACALALRQLGLTVCVVEPSAASEVASFVATDTSDARRFGLRVSAINAVSQALLQQLRCWHYLPQQRLQPVLHMRVGEAGRWLDFAARQSPLQTLAHIVENDLLQAVLWQGLRHAGVEIIAAKVEQLAFDFATDCGVAEGANCLSDASCVTLDDGRQLQAQLLVAADGANSSLRQQAGIGSSDKDYQQHCFVGNVLPQRWHQHSAWQVYHQGLALALLPHNDGSCSLAWYVAATRAEALRQLSIGDFSQQLNAAAQASGLTQLGEIAVKQLPRSFPILRRRAACYAQPGLFLIGDACRTLHPMAGQGMNLALADVAVLQQLLVQAMQYKLPLRHASIAKRYTQKRSEDIWVQNGMDVLDRLFGLTWLQLLRPPALDIMGRLPFWQRPLIDLASGVLQDLPQSLKQY